MEKAGPRRTCFSSPEARPRTVWLRLKQCDPRPLIGQGMAMQPTNGEAALDVSCSSPLTQPSTFFFSLSGAQHAPLDKLFQTAARFLQDACPPTRVPAKSAHSWPVSTQSSGRYKALLCLTRSHPPLHLPQSHPCPELDLNHKLTQCFTTQLDSSPSYS